MISESNTEVTGNKAEVTASAGDEANIVYLRKLAGIS
jgi:hypothetical protein